MELRQLTYFVAVAEELHFSRAAQRLQIAQPPLSQQIQHLERELGVQLLKRTKRRVELTGAGEVFLEGARRMLEQAQHLVRDAQRAEHGEIGRLVIGFVGTAAYEVLPKILREYHRLFPEVELELRQLTTVEQIKALQKERIQLGFLRPPVTEASVKLETILREPLLAVLPEEHPLAVRDRLTLRDLAQEPWILYPQRLGPGTYAQIVAACRRTGFEPRIAQEAREMQTIVGLVAAGLGISLVPATVKVLRKNGVVYREMHDELPFWELAVAYRQGENSALIQKFLEVARG